MYRLMAVRLTADADDNLVDHMAGLWGYVKFTDGKPTIEYDGREPNQVYFLREATRYYQLYDAVNGALLLESDHSQAGQQALSPERIKQLLMHPGIDQVSGQKVPLRFRSAVFRANGHAYLLRVGVSREHDLADLAELRRVLLSLLPAATLIAIFAAWWMAGRGLRPVRDLEREASAISISDLQRRLPVGRTNDELGSLANTFNRVLSRLELSVRQMRNFADFMAHELRTPMTVLRGEAEVQLMRSDLDPEWRIQLESQVEEFDKLSRLVNRFLLLAKAETGAIRLQKRRSDLSEAAVQTAKLLYPAANNTGISLTVDAPEPVPVFADPEWIEQAILNLLDNALKFTSDGGWVRVAVRCDADLCIVEVSDNGQGISAIDLPHIFEHSYRAVAAKPLHRTPGGLGLALTKWIVEQHLGKIDVTSTLGEGSTFRISLPFISSADASASAEEAVTV